MATKVLRNIVKIDEDKCNGCGLCATACAEGAISIIDGKAKLVSDKYCDGLGACIGECPQDAITIEKRESEQFDEEAVGQHLQERENTSDKYACGCDSIAVTQFKTDNQGKDNEKSTADDSYVSMLSHWPVQLTLVPPNASFLQDADLVLAGDCAPFAYAGFHRDFIKNHALLVACPKLDNFQNHQRKLTEILSQSSVKSITVVRMEVPCCSGLVQMARQAIKECGKDIPLREVIIGVRGNIKS